MDEKETQGLSEIDQVEIEPLSDEDLEGVAGGCETNSCSTSNCSNGTKLPSDDSPVS